MPIPLTTSPSSWRYRTLIGTGGIGSGSFFALHGNHTLGREESRAGRFLDRRDYCKQHIIEHYVQVLLGPEFRTIPVGKVGDDAPGRQMITEMQEAGLSTDYVQVIPGEQTLYSLCFIYPDGAGGNLTVEDSASAKVDPACIARAEHEFARFAGTGIALAAPEVPLDARAELLRLGREHRFFNTASFTSGELNYREIHGMLRLIDFLAINRDEAAMLAGLSADQSAETIAHTAVNVLQSIQPQITCSITAGRDGSWTWDGQALHHVPAHKVDVVSTAGAGDSFLSGMLVGHVLGLTVVESQHLATLIAAMKVTSPHTINKDIARDTLRASAAKFNAHLPNRVQQLLETSP